MKTKNIEKQNQTLKEVSKTIFGDFAVLQIVDPKNIKLLKQNARYFKRSTYKQLVDNIKKDQRLSSVPLCHAIDKNIYEVLSGNHRVKVAIDAGVEYILIIVVLKKLSKSKQISIQLSHNALVGLDDPNILADLWTKIDDIKEKLYAGLSSDVVKEIKNIKLITFTTPQVYTKTITFTFTDSEKENIDKIIKELEAYTTNEIHMAHIEQYDDFFKALRKVKKTQNIKNSSLAMVKLLEIVNKQKGYKEG
jgi:hypothetical protein